MSYTQISAGGLHTVLLRSDGSAVACGSTIGSRSDIPPLDDGIFYTQVSAGSLHTVLLRSDGSAVAFGVNFGNCDIPSLKSWQEFFTFAAAGRRYNMTHSDRDHRHK